MHEDMGLYVSARKAMTMHEYNAFETFVEVFGIRYGDLNKATRAQFAKER